MPSLSRSILSLAVVVTTLACSSVVFAQRGALTLPRSVGELTQRADTIFTGHVISATVEPHPSYRGLMTVVVTLHVDSPLKGHLGRTYTFRQYIWDVRDRYDAAGYRKGQELLLLMNAVNENGLTSPVGLNQGRFRILRDSKGNAVAVNGAGNTALFRATSEDAQKRGLALSDQAMRTISRARSGPVSLPVLQEIIKSYAGVR